jgi:hypothetical protein
MFPMPTPAPMSALQARPAPIIFAASTSMVFFSLLERVW